MTEGGESWKTTGCTAGVGARAFVPSTARGASPTVRPALLPSTHPPGGGGGVQVEPAHGLAGQVHRARHARRLVKLPRDLAYVRVHRHLVPAAGREQAQQRGLLRRQAATEPVTSRTPPHNTQAHRVRGSASTTSCSMCSALRCSAATCERMPCRCCCSACSWLLSALTFSWASRDAPAAAATAAS